MRQAFQRRSRAVLLRCVVNVHPGQTSKRVIRRVRVRRRHLSLREACKRRNGPIVFRFLVQSKIRKTGKRIIG